MLPRRPTERHGGQHEVTWDLWNMADKGSDKGSDRRADRACSDDGRDGVGASATQSAPTPRKALTPEATAY